MANDDESERVARAAALRQRIAALKSDHEAEGGKDDSRVANGGSDEKANDEVARPGESPREFIHRRMRELDRDKGKSDASDV
jgi:hypothetical protein